MTIEPPLYDEIVDYWRAAGPPKWFAKDEAFDTELRERFEALHFAAARGELADWAQTAQGALALLILVDQIPRNIFRGSAHAFATDAMARGIANRAVSVGHDKAVEDELRPFFYLPFEHSEALADQDLSVTLCEAHAAETGDEDTAKWAVMHRDIIKRFGRFPHRNGVMGRLTSAEEQAFLDSGGFGG